MGDLEHQARALQGRVDKNLRFGIARGLTETARFASTKLQQQLPQIFDRPTPFTQRAIGFQSATKANLEARVFVRDRQAQYLEMQERGGARLPKPGSPINVAVGQRLNQYGNISRGAIARVRAKPNVFVSKGRGRTAHLAPGIYERLSARSKKGLGSRRGRKVTTGRGKQKTRLNLLVAFERQAKYQPRFRFVERVSKIARANVKAHISASIADAMRTMR
jgi:hypothetical protein